MHMKRLKTMVIMMAAVTASVWSGGAMPEAKKAGSNREAVMPAAEMKFKEAIPGVSKAVLWGDPAKGKYATITRFTKGQKNPLHTHSHDIRIVVISGTMVYDSRSGEKKLGPGSYLLQPKGVRHTSGAGDEADCVFLEESDGPFDIKMVK